ncbi:hypothetical protein ACFX13_047289 [Malus domestica]|uniref:phosphoglycerate kinase, chloroplastic-like n=1 Tax=Malus domestica TaxID=3750 RepID=UPI00049916AC
MFSKKLQELEKQLLDDNDEDDEGDAEDSISPEVEKLMASLLKGGVFLLENVRFYKEEEKNDPEHAKKLVVLADLYVNDAFGTAHRAHASTKGITKFLRPSVADFLLQKELDYLVGAVSSPKRPFAAIVSGSKVSSKIGVIDSSAFSPCMFGEEKSFNHKNGKKSKKNM